MEEEKALDDIPEIPELKIEATPTDLKTSSTEELLPLATNLFETDPVQGAALTGIILGRGKPTVKKQALALAAYLQYCQAANPELRKIKLKDFLLNPPPRLHRVILGMIVGMEAKGYK